MAVSTNLRPIVSVLKKDSRYKRLKETFNSIPIFRMPVDQYIKEVESIHKLREIRRLNTSDPSFIDKVIKANVSDQGHRSRLTEIQMGCIKYISTLQNAIDSLRQHLLLTYSTELRSLKTKEERLGVVNIALRTFIRAIENVMQLKELSQLVVFDIDKASWSLRLTVDAIKSTTKPEVHI